MDERRRKLTRRARKPGGLLVPADFTAVGYAANQVARMVSRGDVVELQPRVYLLVGVPDSRELARQNAIVLTGEWRTPLRFGERDIREDMARVAPLVAALAGARPAG